MFFNRVRPGDCFWIGCFFDFRFVLLLHSSVKCVVSVMLGCRVTAQKMKNSLIENFIFWTVIYQELLAFMFFL